jgi:hypothetical protein
MSKKTTVNSFKEAENFITNIFGVNSKTSKALLKATQEELYVTGKEIISDVKSNHPWKDKSGDLTRSHRAKKRGRLDVQLSANAKHASYLYYGTKRHFVAPKSGGVLAWSQGGKTRYSKGHFVSGVWAGKERTGRSKGTRSTPKNAKELKWLEKGWKKKRNKTLNRVGKVILKEFGFR